MLSSLSAPGLELPDRWMLSRQHRLTRDVTRLMDEYQYGEAGQQIREFLWNEVCDWYIEICKERLSGKDDAAREVALQGLVYVLERTLRLLHPFMPFVTEAIWQNLPHRGDALMMARWPTGGRVDEAAEVQMEQIVAVVRGIRNARSEYKVEPARRIGALVSAGQSAAFYEEHRDLLVTQARLAPNRLHIADAFDPPPQVATVVAGGVTIYLPLAEMLNIGAERRRLLKQLNQAREESARTENLLANRAFTEKAPEQVVEREREKQAILQEQVAQLAARLESLK